MAQRTAEWMQESESFIMEHCKCKILPYADATEEGLLYQDFIQHENENSEAKLICTTAEKVFSLKRLIFREKDNHAYIGLLRTKVKKGYWSQFVCVLHMHEPRAFIMVISKDMANNVMQRFVWKMFQPMQFRVLKAVKRHLLFEDIGFFSDGDSLDEEIIG
jgi:hypothetical protein